MVFMRGVSDSFWNIGLNLSVDNLKVFVDSIVSKNITVIPSCKYSSIWLIYEYRFWIMVNAGYYLSLVNDNRVNELITHGKELLKG